MTTASKRMRLSGVCRHQQHDLCRKDNGVPPTWCACPCHMTGSRREGNAVNADNAPRPTSNVATCLDCKVLPPFSVVLCPLHAAAPDLLAALEELVARCDGAEGVRADGSNIQTMRARAAITKATGASNESA